MPGSSEAVRSRDATRPLHAAADDSQELADLAADASPF